MLIYPRPSKECGKCYEKDYCSCRCHDVNLINSKHYHIRIEEQEYKVKPVVDLEHFRD